jgi:hypothetical protein
MSNLNALLDQFQRLEAQVRTLIPSLCTSHREALRKASRNLFYACRGNGEESFPPPMAANAIMKNGVAPAEAWGTGMMAVGGEVKGPSDVVPALLSPGFSYVPREWLIKPLENLHAINGHIPLDPMVVVNNHACVHPSFNVIGTLTGRSECGKTAAEMIERISTTTTLKAEQDCVIGGIPIHKGDELKINNLYARQVEMIKELEALNRKTEGLIPIGKRGQSLGKSEQVMRRGVTFDECVRQGESRTHRAGSISVDIPVPTAEEALKNLANKNEIHAKSYAEMAYEMLYDEPVIINQEKKDADSGY